MDRPSIVTVRQGLGSAGVQLSQTVYEYNAAGDVTSTGRWLDTTKTMVSASATYDGYGNTLTATDENGHTSTTTYDSTYHVFPAQTCNALAQCTPVTYDPVLGVQLTQTDPNLKTTSWTYDVFGRKTREATPGRFIDHDELRRTGATRYAVCADGGVRRHRRRAVATGLPGRAGPDGQDGVGAGPHGGDGVRRAGVGVAGQ